MIEIGIKFEKDIFEKSPDKVSGSMEWSGNTALTNLGNI
jgi:hypothetical protein